ncbi:MAG: VC0807 family protein [Acidimicrobiales bacterium]
MVLDVVGPLITYYALRSAGISTVLSLVASGLPPAFGIALGVLRRRHLDAIGALVLAGIVVGTALGLASGNAHLVLLDGTIPTVAFGSVCVGSLWSGRPLIYRFALEAAGVRRPLALSRFPSRLPRHHPGMGSRLHRRGGRPSGSHRDGLDRDGEGHL